MEIIFAVAIISVLVSAAVPKFSQITDKLTLDYEMKNFYSEVEFASSVSRSASYAPGIFNYKINQKKSSVTLQVFKNTGRYQLLRDTAAWREEKVLPRGFSIDYNNQKLNNIVFQSDGRVKGELTGTITITSRYKDTAEIIFDSVGRWRGSRNGK